MSSDMILLILMIAVFVCFGLSMLLDKLSEHIIEKRMKRQRENFRKRKLKKEIEWMEEEKCRRGE